MGSILNLLEFVSILFKLLVGIASFLLKKKKIKKKKKKKKTAYFKFLRIILWMGNIEQMFHKFDVYSFGFVIAELLNNKMEFYLGCGISDGVFACMF